MNRLLAIALSVVLLAPANSGAETLVPVGHSTVHVGFITSHSKQILNGMGGGMGMAGTQTPMARVGDLIVPADGIRPIRITIDGEFVGHALVGSAEVKPVFVLPKGQHKFTFAIDGHEPISAEITVLGAGSKQHLIVKLPTQKPHAKNAKAGG